MLQSRVSDREVKIAGAVPPIVLTPRHFVGISIEVRAGDMMVGSDFGAAHPKEK
jgi:hypothetical protein